MIETSSAVKNTFNTITLRRHNQTLNVVTICLNKATRVNKLMWCEHIQTHNRFEIHWKTGQHQNRASYVYLYE